MYRLTEAVWVGEPAAPGAPAEAPRALLVGLVALVLAIVGVGVGNAALVTWILGPAASGALP